MPGETVGPMPTPETENNPERSSYKPEEGLQARLLLGIDALDPGKTYNDNIDFSQITQVPAGVDERIQTRSWKERQDTANTSVDTWAQNMVTAIERSQGFFNNEAGKGPKYVEAINSVFSIQLKGNFDARKARDIYNEYGKTPEGFTAFRDKIQAHYTTKEITPEELEALQWFGRIFGANTSEILAQRVDVGKKIQDTAKRDELANNAKAEEGGAKRINRLNDKEKSLLTFLWGNGAAAEQTADTDITPTDAEPTDATTDTTDAATDTTPTVAPTPEPTAPTPEAPQLASVVTKLNALKQPLNEENPIIKEYFVENPSKGMPTLTEDEKNAVIRAEQLPFFLKAKGRLRRLIRGHTTSDEVVPYVYLLEAAANKRPDALKQQYPGAPDPRFIEAIKSTGNDSSVLALAAVSAPDSEKQAYVYRDMAEVLVQIFESKPNLFKDWLNAQMQDSNYSANLFLEFDRERSREGENENFLLITPGLTDGKIDPDKFNTKWQERLGALKTALASGNLEEYHHRWIEMMSKAVDMKKVNDLIRSKSTAAAPTPTPPAATT